MKFNLPKLRSLRLRFAINLGFLTASIVALFGPRR